MKLKELAQTYLSEDYQLNELKDVLIKLNIFNYKVLGIGQHGIAILNKDNNKVYKFTKSDNEFKIAQKQHKLQTKTLPKIYNTGIIDGFKYYIRDIFTPIEDDFIEKLYEDLEDVQEFFYSKTKDVRKSQTNLSYYYDDKFLNFLNDLKRDLKTLGFANKFDISGMSLNIFYDDNGQYVLVDF
jgi:hypothetical protein